MDCTVHLQLFHLTLYSLKYLQYYKKSKFVCVCVCVCVEAVFYPIAYQLSKNRTRAPYITLVGHQYII
jgi:hypothetical protein